MFMYECHSKDKSLMSYPPTCSWNTTIIFTAARLVCWWYVSRVFILIHYNDVIMCAVASQIAASPSFTQPRIQAQIKENIKAPRHWHLCGEFTGDRWIHRRKGHAVTRKMFPFDDVFMFPWQEHAWCCISYSVRDIWHQVGWDWHCEAYTAFWMSYQWIR